MRPLSLWSAEEGDCIGDAEGYNGVTFGGAKAC